MSSLRPNYQTNIFMITLQISIHFCIAYIYAGNFNFKFNFKFEAEKHRMAIQYRFLTKANPKNLNSLPFGLSTDMLKNVSDSISGWDRNTVNM